MRCRYADNPLVTNAICRTASTAHTQRYTYMSTENSLWRCKNRTPWNYADCKRLWRHERRTNKEVKHCPLHGQLARKHRRGHESHRTASAVSGNIDIGYGFSQWLLGCTTKDSTIYATDQSERWIAGWRWLSHAGRHRSITFRDIQMVLGTPELPPRLPFFSQSFPSPIRSYCPETEPVTTGSRYPLACWLYHNKYGQWQGW